MSDKEVVIKRRDPKLRKVKALSRMAGSIRANPGDVLELSAKDAEPLLAGGYAEALDNEADEESEELAPDTGEEGGDDADGAGTGDGAGGRTAKPRRSKKAG